MCADRLPHMALYLGVARRRGVGRRTAVSGPMGPVAHERAIVCKAHPGEDRGGEEIGLRGRAMLRAPAEAIGLHADLRQFWVSAVENVGGAFDGHGHAAAFSTTSVSQRRLFYGVSRT